MAQLKWEKYIVKARPPVPMAETRAERPRMGFDERVERPQLHMLMALNNRMVNGNAIIICQWVWAGEEPGTQGPHTHPYDEVIGFAGTNPNDPNDLGGIAELWMEDEQYIIDKSFMVYVPKNVKHCPLTIRDIKYNILHLDIQLTAGEFREDYA